MKKLTQKRLKELLHYDPATGFFTWRKSRPGIKSNRIAGSISNIDGYVRICVDYNYCLASRLAWFYIHGYFPENEVDHKNRIRHDNRWKNLKHVSRVCNSRNCNISKWNTSGITGVSWNKEKQKWAAYINIIGKRFRLGYFRNKIGAARARWNAEIKHGFPNCNTTSTAYQYLQNKNENNSAVN